MPLGQITSNSAAMAIAGVTAVIPDGVAIDVRTGAPAVATLLSSAGLSLLRRRAGNAFQHDSLLRAALRTAGDQAAVVVVTRNDAVVTFWPLRLEDRYGIRIATDLAAPFAQYSDVIGEPLDTGSLELLRARLRDDLGVDVILCRGVREDSGLAPALGEGSVVEQSAAPYIDLAAFGTFERYCTRFSKQTARTRRQRRRKLEASHGPLDFTVLDGAQGRDAVALALQWKSDWLKASGLSSGIVNVRDRQRTLLASIDDPATHISVLSARGKPIAAELGFACGGNYAAYLGAYDPDFAGFSPGQEQMLLTIAWCFDQWFARYDLLPPRDAYKLHWTREHDEEQVRDHCVPLSAAGALYALARRYARAPVKRTILSVPAHVRVAVRRYGPVAAGIGATAATISLVTD
jgi:CelD/BcsL family acetyltransferase involved in cellulose biosynthesis